MEIKIHALFYFIEESDLRGAKNTENFSSLVFFQMAAVLSQIFFMKGAENHAFYRNTASA